MRSIWINKNYIAKIASTVTGGIYAFLGFIGMLVPLDEILSDKMSIWVRSIISISVLTGIWCCCFIIVSVILMNKKRFKVLSANNGHALYLQYGDIFNVNEVIEPGKRRNIVIPVNRCFDTHVDNHMVSVYPVREADYHTGQSRRGKDLLCHASGGGLHQPKAFAQYGAAGTVQYYLPDRRGRAG